MERRELIKLEDIANAYQGILGNEFKVYVDSMLDVDETKIPIVMYATRMPYKLENIDTENLQIGFSAYVECGNIDCYLDIITKISKLLGFNKTSFESNNKIYKMYSFIDFSRPLTDPVVDSGKFMQSLTLSGSCLICGPSGAIIGNDIETYLIINPGDELKKIEGKVEVLTDITNIVYSPESPQLANEDVARAYNTSQVYSYTYTILILNDKIGERLLKAVKNYEPFELNERIDVKEVFPLMNGDSFEVTKRLCLTGLTLTRNAGAFMTMQLSMQDMLDIDKLEVSDGQ